MLSTYIISVVHVSKTEKFQSKEVGNKRNNNQKFQSKEVENKKKRKTKKMNVQNLWVTILFTTNGIIHFALCL